YPLEFISAREIAKRHPSPPDHLPVDGTHLALVSDDTQMTLFTAEGVIRAVQRYADRGICNPQGVLRNAYRRWYYTQTGEGGSESARGFLLDDPRLHVRRAPGNTCLSALASGEKTLSTVDAPPNDSKGCGAVMRAAPIGLAASDRQTAFELGRDSGLLT